MPDSAWLLRRSPRSLALAALFVSAVITTPHFAAAQSSIGIYSDVGGNNCTLSDVGAGVINAYVVVRPGNNGATAVQFAAPKPECFTGTFLTDEEAPQTLVLGDSQTGVAVSLLSCTYAPRHVLTIQYVSFGSTPPCCEYPVLPDPLSGGITVVDCALDLEASVGVVSTINPDESCLCTGNSFPGLPQNPIPNDAHPSASAFSTLAWAAWDFDDNLAEFDLYFGTDPVPPLVAAGLVVPAWDPGPLSPLTKYYWKVVVRDDRGLETPGDVWTFTTRVLNSPPAPPGGPLPANNATDQLPGMVEWRTTDIDGDTLRFDVYFGTDPDPPLVLANTLQWWYAPGPLAFSTNYYWRVVARDPAGLEAAGPSWSFRTRPANYAPNVPYGPSPANGATARPTALTLSWLGTDADGDTLVFDVYFGASESPPLVSAGQREFACAVDSLEFLTTYRWRVVARDPSNAERTSPLWSFTTRPENYPPAVLYPSPANNATNKLLSLNLSWQSGDADGHTIVHDVYFGTVTPPPLVSSGQASRSFATGPMAPSTRHYWKVIARDELGAESPGPVWSFTTRANTPPNVPSSPSPANNASNRPLAITFGWQGGDADGHAVTYDVHLDTTTTPGLVASGLTARAYTDTLAFGKRYYWRIVARDAAGAETSGAMWTFTTRAENLPPATPSGPFPANNAVNRLVTTALSWQCSDPDGDALAYDVYLGTETPPVLHTAGFTMRSFFPGPLEASTRYYWRIVARDSRGLEASGPIWTFTTSSNSVPSLPFDPSPEDGGVASLAPVLSWSATDPNTAFLNFEVFFGTDSPPPSMAWGLTETSFAPGPLVPGARYYWRVTVSDGQLWSTGPIWSFIAAHPGDANLDAHVTVEDAACALRMFLGDFACSGTPAIGAADVDCSGLVTPRDARCIHASVSDGSCPFCADGLALRGPVSALPAVSVAATWTDHDSLVVRLAVAGVAAFASFGFEVESDPSVQFVRAARAGATDAFEALAALAVPGRVRVGGYALSGAGAESAVEFVELRFVVPDGSEAMFVDGYVDDLEGAERLPIAAGSIHVPVLIASFDASVMPAGVELRWRLSGDETAERFTLLRRDGVADGTRAVGEGDVTGSTGSYIDASVMPATTYHYELLVRTRGGNEFRSPVATVTTATAALALAQNHPNPFNPTTVIPYTLPGGSTPQRVRLLILDVAGGVVRTLVDESQAGGSHEATWDGRDDRGGPVSSGVYFYVLDAGGERRTRKLVLLK
jgi:hypothetical protein